MKFNGLSNRIGAIGRSRQLRAVALALLMVMWAPAMFTGGFVPHSDHDGVALGEEEEWEQVDTYTEHSGAVWSVTWGDDGYLYSSSLDEEVHRINPETMQQVDTYTGFSSGIWSVTWGGDGYVYAGGRDDEVHRIDPQTMEQAGTYTGHSDTIFSVTWGDDGYVYSGSREGEVHRINPETMEQADTYTEHSAGVYSVTFGNDGYLYSGSSDSEVHRINPETMQQVDTYTGHSSTVESLSLGDDGYLYSGSSDDELHRIDPETMQQVDTYTEHGDNVYSVTWGADGYLYSSGRDDKVHRIDPETMQQADTYTGHSATIQGLTFGNDGYVYSGDNNDELHKSDPGTEMATADFSGHVTDASGDPIEGATITSDDGGETETDADGFYALGVDHGDRELTASYTTATGDTYTNTKTVSIAEDEEKVVDFQLGTQGDGSYTIQRPDPDQPGSFTMIDDRPVEMHIYEATRDNMNEPASYWLDSHREPIASSDDSQINFTEADGDGPYVVAFRSDDSSADETYRDYADGVWDTGEHYRVTLPSGEGVQQQVAIRDFTGDWPPEDVTIRVEGVHGDLDGQIVDRAALGANNLGTIYVPEEGTYRFYAEHDSAHLSDRFVGETDVFREISSDAIIFDIRDPLGEWEDVIGDDAWEDWYDDYPDDGPYSDPWDDEDDIAYPPSISTQADNRDIVVGETVEFTADVSTHGDATVESIEWELPDGSTETGESVTWEATESDVGGHMVKATVEDSEGLYASSTTSVYVAETEEMRALPPTADIEILTDNPTVGDPVRLESASEVDDAVSIESIEWDLTGDGSFDDATGETAETVPESDGIVEVGIRVTDTNNATDEYYTAFYAVGDLDALHAQRPDGDGGFGGVVGGGGVEGAGDGVSPLFLAGFGLLALWLLNRRTGTVPRAAFLAVPIGAAVAFLVPASFAPAGVVTLVGAGLSYVGLSSLSRRFA